MRIEYPGTTDQHEQKIRNRLQQRMARFREKFSMVSWRDTAGENNAIRDRVLNTLIPAQFAARGGLGSTRGSTPGSMDSQGRVIPLPGRRARGSAAAADTISQVQQTQARTVHAGPSNGSTVDTGFTPVNSQVHRVSESHGGSRTSQQNVKTNLGNLNRQQQSRPSISIKPLLNHRLNEQNATMGAAQQHHPSTSYTDDPALLPYSSFSSAVPPPEGTRQRASGVTNPRMQDGQASAAYAGNRTTQQAGNMSYTGPSESLQVPDGPSTDEDYGDVESLDTDDNHDLSEEDSNEEPNAGKPLVEEDTQMEPLPDEVCYELKRYLKEDRARTLMCLDGRISLDELLLGMERNQANLKQGIKRARGEASDDDEVEYLENQRAKRPRRGQGTAGSSSQPRPGPQNLIYSGFDGSQPGPSGDYPRQGPLANKSCHPAARPIGSAVQRLHNDRQRRPTPKATTAQKERDGYLRNPQTDPVIDNEWTVYGFHTGSQQPPYPSKQEDSLRGQGLYTNLGRPQRVPEPYQPQRDNGVGTSSPYTTTGAPQPRHSSHHQHQPGSERLRSVPSHAIQDTGDLPSHDQNSLTRGRDSHNPGSSAARVQLRREGNGNIEPRQAYQHFEESTIQNEPFFSDELFEGNLNGHTDNNHVGNMYTHAQQREIDEYYRRLMTPHPRPETETNAPETAMPPPPPVPQVPQVTNSATQPVRESDLAVGDIAGWDPAWSEFVNDHDAEPLLRANHPDEYKHTSPPESPGS